MSGGHFFDIFWTFFQRQPQHQDTFQTLSRHFLDIFLGGCQEAPKGILGHFLDIFLGGCQEAPKGILGYFLDIFWQFHVLTAFSR